MQAFEIIKVCVLGGVRATRSHSQSERCEKSQCKDGKGELNVENFETSERCQTRRQCIFSTLSRHIANLLLHGFTCNTLQRSGDETNLFERGRTIWKDGIQPPPRRGEQAKTRAPSPPRTRGTLNDSNDIAKKMRRSHNTRDQSSNQETMRDARIRLLTQKPAREQTPPEKKAGWLPGSIVDRFKRRDKES